MGSDRRAPTFGVGPHSTIGATARAFATPLIVVSALTLATACAGPWSGRGDGGDELVMVVEELASIVLALERSETIAVVGFRDGAGHQSTATRILDDVLVSSLVRSNLALAPADTRRARWTDGTSIDAKMFRQAGGRIVVGGRLQDQGRWVYIRLFAADRETGVVLASGSRRLSGAQLQKAVEDRGEGHLDVGEGFEVAAELHLVGVRSVGGFEQQVPIEANGTLEPTDRLQIRFDVESDCQVWAFLYSSTGNLRTLFANETVYSGRDHFGPSENGWLTAGESGEVNSLYFVAARRVEEETADLFEEMGKLIDQGQVDRYDGFDKLDEVLRGFFADRVSEETEVEIVRAVAEDSLTEPIRHLLKNGTSVMTRGEKLGPSILIVRALRYEVL